MNHYHSLMALALLGSLAGAAAAQSSVTLYGRIDAGPNGSLVFAPLPSVGGGD